MTSPELAARLTSHFRTSDASFCTSLLQAASALALHTDMLTDMPCRSCSSSGASSNGAASDAGSTSTSSGDGGQNGASSHSQGDGAPTVSASRPRPSDAELAAALSTVRLDAVLARGTARGGNGSGNGDGGGGGGSVSAAAALDVVQDWASILSLGEQQRLAFARSASVLSCLAP